MDSELVAQRVKYLAQYGGVIRDPAHRFCRWAWGFTTLMQAITMCEVFLK